MHAGYLYRGRSAFIPFPSCPGCVPKAVEKARRFLRYTVTVSDQAATLASCEYVG